MRASELSPRHLRNMRCNVFVRSTMSRHHIIKHAATCRKNHDARGIKTDRKDITARIFVTLIVVTTPMRNRPRVEFLLFFSARSNDFRRYPTTVVYKKQRRVHRLAFDVAFDHLPVKIALDLQINYTRYLIKCDYSSGKFLKLVICRSN